MVTQSNYGRLAPESNRSFRCFADIALHQQRPPTVLVYRDMEALVLMHVDSLGAYAAEASRNEARAYRDAMVDAIHTHPGPVVVVTQGWGEPWAAPILAAARSRTDAVIVRFDEAEQSWGAFFTGLHETLLDLGVDSVRLGGGWYDDSGVSGCATAVQSRLRSLGYDVMPDYDLLLCEPEE